METLDLADDLAMDMNLALDLDVWISIRERGRAS